MDWDSARIHCSEKKWHWTLRFIDQAENEMKKLEEQLKNYEELQKAQPFCNSSKF